MIGRAAYYNPWMFSDFDRVFYNKSNLGYSRKEILQVRIFMLIKYRNGANMVTRL